MIYQAGNICKKEQSSLTANDVSFKGQRDLVTVIDRKVEAYIIEHILKAYPSHGILGEETGRTNESSDHLWIIDPIDGTTSFCHQQPFYAISIALQYQQKTILGAVLAPWMNELFYADENLGAFLNEKPIHVTHRTELMDCVLGTGFACLRKTRGGNNLKYLNKILPKSRDIRRYGSAALDLCYVACGRLDGFWEMNLNIYDIAAGVFIVEKAGGTISDFNGNSHYPEDGIAAANPYIHPQLLDNF